MRSVATCTGNAFLLFGYAIDSPGTTDVCWICLQPDNLLRNPTGCTCTNGGWVHRECMADYLYSPATPVTISHVMGDANAFVNVVHGPCGHPMKAVDMTLCQHRELWKLVFQTIGPVAMSTYGHPGGKMLAAFVLLLFLRVFQEWPFHLVALAVAIAAPLSQYEIKHWPRFLFSFNAAWMLVIIATIRDPIILFGLFAGTTRAFLACATEIILVKHCEWKIKMWKLW